MFLKRIALLAGLCVLFAGCTTVGNKSGHEIDRNMLSYAGDGTAKEGVHYLFGRGVEQDDAKAFHYFSEAAKQGDKYAMNEVAYLYAAGKGTPKNYNLAMTWYKNAAKAGIVSAQYNVGFMYLHGLGTKPDKKLALQWIKKAATHGFEPAQVTLKKLA